MFLQLIIRTIETTAEERETARLAILRANEPSPSPMETKDPEELEAGAPAPKGHEHSLVRCGWVCCRLDSYFQPLSCAAGL